MKEPASQQILNIESLRNLIDLEPFIILSSLFFVAWIFYRLFLAGVSEERHRNLRRRFAGLVRHYMVFTLIFFLALIAKHNSALDGENLFEKAFPYFALLSLGWGFLVFVKTSSLILLQYLFLGSMRHGVPVLIVNIFSLVLVLVAVLWLASAVFNVQLAPLLATSAFLSVVLGLALQDTLGNLFAGISLQFDKSFEIGNWLEIFSSQGKVVGQVKEISWRATTLVGWSDELIIMPNRVLASSQISNFSLVQAPIVRSHFFRLPYGADMIRAKKVLLDSLNNVDDVIKFPEPLCLVMDTTDSWQSLKLIYYIENYGAQFVIGDKVFNEAHAALLREGFDMAHQIVKIKEV